MTYPQALLIVRNPDCYAQDTLRQAAVYILGSLGASEEDILDASAVVEPKKAGAS